MRGSLVKKVVTCQNCHGLGICISPDHVCSTCSGEKKARERFFLFLFPLSFSLTIFTQNQTPKKIIFIHPHYFPTLIFLFLFFPYQFLTIFHSKTTEFFLPPGIEYGSIITIVGEGNCSPDETPGDVSILIIPIKATSGFFFFFFLIPLFIIFSL